MKYSYLVILTRQERYNIDIILFLLINFPFLKPHALNGFGTSESLTIDLMCMKVLRYQYFEQVHNLAVKYTRKFDTKQSWPHRQVQRSCILQFHFKEQRLKFKLELFVTVILHIIYNFRKHPSIDVVYLRKRVGNFNHYNQALNHIMFDIRLIGALYFNRHRQFA